MYMGVRFTSHNLAPPMYPGSQYGGTRCPTNKLIELEFVFIFCPNLHKMFPRRLSGSSS